MKLDQITIFLRVWNLILQKTIVLRLLVSQFQFFFKSARCILFLVTNDFEEWEKPMESIIIEEDSVCSENTHETASNTTT